MEMGSKEMSEKATRWTKTASASPKYSGIAMPDAGGATWTAEIHGATWTVKSSRGVWANVEVVVTCTVDGVTRVACPPVGCGVRAAKAWVVASGAEWV